ncbi:hypothetical protein PC113_g8298 [Phytophthora cactorum]|uniref:Uncharacterized protein n=1 Tax=Phytophthora cactorum TaxID=29920 RepID=A0A8T0ZE33_9STRA|nr:hypothetical protein PC111_g6938 [Phytophthora cactorum]KAG2860183.1 hypothetical protein PC113_g8298 [Phytophthora cactorum]
MRHRLPQRTSVVPSLQLQHVSGCLISIVDEVPFTLRGLQTCGLSGQVPKPPSKFDKKQTILHTNASLTPNSVTDRVAAKMIEHLTHHFHRHICSNNGPLGQAEKDVLNIEETRHGSEDEADIETFRPMKELAKQMLRACGLPRGNEPRVEFQRALRAQAVHCAAGWARVPRQGRGGTYFTGRPLIVISSSGGKAPPAHEDYVFPFLCLAKNDKEEYFQNAINKANSIADNEVQSHKLSLDRNCG